jgi:carboxypeptidase Q
MLQRSTIRRALWLTTAILTSSLALAQEVDLGTLTRIRQEGFRRSKVMDTLGDLTDRIGPRLTGSANLRKANDWTRDQLTSWGLVNSHLESWGPFGAGWAFESASVRMVTPDVALLSAIPRPWTPGTAGTVRGAVIKAKLETKEDLEKNKGKLAGKIVLIELATPPAGPAPSALTSATSVPTLGKPHYNDDDLEDLFHYPLPTNTRGGGDEAARGERTKRLEFANQLREFLATEKPLAIITSSARSIDGTIFVQAGGATYEKGKHDAVTALAMSFEHYSRISRLIAQKTPVEIELNVTTTMDDAAPNPNNTIAEIPGEDPKLKDEVVMLGAHMDSWTGATGATDNAIGCAVAMEAVRILKAAGVHPRRTIRVALWTGEEQGLLGSAAYIEQHFASRPPPSNPEEAKLPKSMWRTAGRPLALKPEHAKLAAYFNLDNGAGKIRGIFAQENAATVPIFESWVAPIKDLGVSTVTMRTTAQTDHISFDNVGLPGFQFLQEELDYSTRTHHSNMDSVEHVKRDDAAQSSVVMAWFVYNAAMRDQMLPRKPLPPEEKPEKPAASETTAGAGQP